MFSISNRIAYDDTMVSATPSRTSVIGSLMGESRWIDIPGVPGGGHYVAAQAEMVEKMLRRLTRSLALDELHLYVISPFRLMASGLESRLRPLGDEAWGRWVRDRVGTIHTAQGREADAVILALGGDPLRRRALLWAGATPNILNVAVTRAKERLYVVGDAAAWASVPHFRDLHARLRIVAPAGAR
jgi:hypothetical protein